MTYQPHSPNASGRADRKRQNERYAATRLALVSGWYVKDGTSDLKLAIPGDGETVNAPDVNPVADGESS